MTLATLATTEWCIYTVYSIYKHISVPWSSTDFTWTGDRGGESQLLWCLEVVSGLPAVGHSQRVVVIQAVDLPQNRNLRLRRFPETLNVLHYLQSHAVISITHTDTQTSQSKLTVTDPTEQVAGRAADCPSPLDLLAPIQALHHLSEGALSQSRDHFI